MPILRIAPASRPLFARHDSPGDPSRGAGRRPPFARSSARLCRRQPRRLHQRAGRLPAQRCRHLVYASSSSVYGANTKLPFSVDDHVDHPVSLYAATKKANELMAHSYSHLYRIPTTGLRFFTVYGPWGRPDMAIFLFTKAILEGRPIKLFNHGKMRRDFTYIDDVSPCRIAAGRSRSAEAMRRPPARRRGSTISATSAGRADACGSGSGEGTRAAPRSRRCCRCSLATCWRPSPISAI